MVVFFLASISAKRVPSLEKTQAHFSHDFILEGILLAHNSVGLNPHLITIGFLVEPSRPGKRRVYHTMAKK